MWKVENDEKYQENSNHCNKTALMHEFIPYNGYTWLYTVYYGTWVYLEKQNFIYYLFGGSCVYKVQLILIFEPEILLLLFFFLFFFYFKISTSFFLLFIISGNHPSLLFVAIFTWCCFVSLHFFFSLFDSLVNNKFALLLATNRSYHWEISFHLCVCVCCSRLFRIEFQNEIEKRHWMTTYE